MTKLFNDFFKSEKSGGLILILCTIVSLLVVNSSFQEGYQRFWNYDLSGHSLQHWINDGLMAIFFLLIGLELEREIYIGELSEIKNAMLPIAGALGGIIFPAGFYLFFNYGLDTSRGAGIPMATDIAFALGILSLLGKRVPLSLKIFLTALAVIDDLCAIIIIALFYSKTLVWTNLLISLGVFAFLLILNRRRVHKLLPYLLGGVVMWYFMLNSGVHATITGVLLAFAIPFGNGDSKSISYKLQSFLHTPVAFVILPLFALANTAIILHEGWQENFTQPYALGILSGLIIGKPLGITLMGLLAIATGLCRLPPGIKWKHIVGAGFLGGIGFTMSIFITLLAFDDSTLINNTKFMILLASLVAGLTGYLLLNFSLPAIKPKSIKPGEDKL